MLQQARIRSRIKMGVRIGVGSSHSVRHQALVEPILTYHASDMKSPAAAGCMLKIFYFFIFLGEEGVSESRIQNLLSLKSAFSKRISLFSFGFLV
jgi:hypothetical protein